MKKSILTICLIFLGVEASALEVSLNSHPGNYRTFRLNGKRLIKKVSAKNFSKFKFEIPSRFVVKKSNGEVDLAASLKKWRKGTPVGNGHPRTDRRGIGYYPFKDSKGNYRYIALEHINSKKPNLVSVENTVEQNNEPEIDLSASTQEEVEIDLSPKPAVTAGETVSDVSSSSTTETLSEAEKQRRASLVANRIPKNVLKPAIRDQERLRAEEENSKANARGKMCRIVLDGKSTSCNHSKQRSWKDINKFACIHQSSGQKFCSSYMQGALRRVHIASSELGLDPKQLTCMVMIESQFKHSTRSSKGAAGITQFMPTAGRETAADIRRNYKSEWRNYQRRIGGRPDSISSVTGSSIRHGRNVSHGIFAMGVYLRNTMNKFASGNKESKWGRYLKNGGNPSNFFHAQIAAYNWRPYKSDNFFSHVVERGGRMTNYPRMPRETKNYIKLFNRCMYKTAGWDFRGRASRAKLRACKVGSSQPVCGSGSFTDSLSNSGAEGVN